MSQTPIDVQVSPSTPEEVTCPKGHRVPLALIEWKDGHVMGCPQCGTSMRLTIWKMASDAPLKAPDLSPHAAPAWLPDSNTAENEAREKDLEEQKKGQDEERKKKGPGFGF